jgi:uncharacterized protein YjbI with pentapeptide repeats
MGSGPRPPRRGWQDGRVARRRGAASIDWDRLEQLGVPDPDEAAAADIRPGRTHDALSFNGLTGDELTAPDATFLDCRIADAGLDEALLRGTRLSTVVLADLRATSFDLAEGAWNEVAVRRARIGALIGHGAALAQVTVQQARVDYANLRGATLTQVQFLGCRFDELDLTQAQLTDVRFRDCQVGRLAIQGATLTRTDLTGADLEELDDAGALRGATVSSEQLVRLAPALAQHLGITVT